MGGLSPFPQAPLSLRGWAGPWGTTARPEAGGRGWGDPPGFPLPKGRAFPVKEPLAASPAGAHPPYIPSIPLHPPILLHPPLPSSPSSPLRLPPSLCVPSIPTGPACWASFLFHLDTSGLLTFPHMTGAGCRQSLHGPPRAQRCG